MFSPPYFFDMNGAYAIVTLSHTSQNGEAEAAPLLDSKGSTEVIHPNENRVSELSVFL